MADFEITDTGDDTPTLREVDIDRAAEALATGRASLGDLLQSHLRNVITPRAVASGQVSNNGAPTRARAIWSNGKVIGLEQLGADGKWTTDQRLTDRVNEIRSRAAELAQANERSAAQMIDPNREATAGQRATASLLRDTDQEIAFYKRQLGKDNVSVVNGRIVLRDPKGGRPYYADNPKGNALDLADMAGGAIETGAGMMGAAAGGLAGPAGVYAGGIVGGQIGNAAKQALAEKLAGQPISGGELLRTGLADAALPLAGKVLGGATKTAYRALRPSAGLAAAEDQLARKMAKTETKAIESDIPLDQFSKEGQAIEEGMQEAVGKSYKLTAGQKTGNRFLLMAEKTAAQTPEGLNAFGELYRGQSRGALEHLGKITDMLRSKPGTVLRGDLGREVGNLTQKLDRQIFETGRKAAKPYYDEALAGGVTISGDQTKAVLREIVAEHSGGLASDKQARKHAETLLKEWEKPGVSLLTFQRQMEKMGQIARGDELSSFNNYAQSERSRIANRVLDALRSDLDAAADRAEAGLTRRGGKFASNAAPEALRKARALTADMYAESRKFRSASVASMLDMDPAELTNGAKVLDRLRQMDPTVRKDFVDKVLSKDSDLQASVAAAEFDRVITKGGAEKANAFGANLGPGKLKPATMFKSIREESDLLSDLIGGSNPEARANIKLAMENLRRLNLGPELTGSQTEFAKQMTNTGIVPKVLGWAAEKGPESTRRALQATADFLQSNQRLMKSLNDPVAQERIAKLAEHYAQAQKPGKWGQAASGALRKAAAELGEYALSRRVMRGPVMIAEDAPFKVEFANEEQKP